MLCAGLAEAAQGTAAERAAVREEFRWWGTSEQGSSLGAWPELARKKNLGNLTQKSREHVLNRLMVIFRKTGKLGDGFVAECAI